MTDCEANGKLHRSGTPRWSRVLKDEEELLQMLQRKNVITGEAVAKGVPSSASRDT